MFILGCVFVKTGHFLGVLASWIVQVGIDIYRFFKSTKANEDDEVVDVTEPLRILVKKIRGVTFKCGGCLIFASVGAGIGAKLIRPAIGQWIGTTLPWHHYIINKFELP